MRSLMGVILTGCKKPGLKELAEIRSASAIPVGGKYRAIDFPLSSMVNSGIRNVAIITQYSYRSLMDHLGSGKEWDLDRRKDGLFIFPPSAGNDDTGWYRGSADAMYKNIMYFSRSYEDFVVIAQGNCVYNMNFSSALDFHIKKKADVTLLYRNMNDYSADELRQLGIVKVDSESRIIDLQEKPENPETTDGSLGIYIIERRLLIYMLEKSAARGQYDFVKDILTGNLDSLRVYGYRYRGYWRSLNTVETYYKCNMEMLDPGLIYALFVRNGKIFTKVKDETPAKYNEEARVSNSIIADGCIIDGTVENSVLFRGVTVKRGARIKDSIIMQGSVVEEGASLEGVILDKNVMITKHRQLKGEGSWPVTVSKNAVV
jgi:glucose-1-phosphate adenylyltransferase